VENFGPEFTYPIFGEDEAIFGYQGLKISLSFAAHNLKPHLAISYDRKFPDQGEIKATDIGTLLQDFLPQEAFSDSRRSVALADDAASTFAPPGQKLHTYSSDGTTYEIYATSLADAHARRILENMQIFVPLFIEGGTMLELEHPWIVERWKVYFLYKVDAQSSPSTSRYSLAGYSTSFRTFALPDRKSNTSIGIPTQVSEQEIDTLVAQWAEDAAAADTSHDPLDLPSRERLSQFIILPPYQGQGLGSQLYNTMYADLTAPSNVYEFTVEDPNEAFDVMRDVCDLTNLRSHNNDFAALKINVSVDVSKLGSDQHIPGG